MEKFRYFSIIWLWHDYDGVTISKPIFQKKLFNFNPHAKLGNFDALTIFGIGKNSWKYRVIGYRYFKTFKNCDFVQNLLT